MGEDWRSRKRDETHRRIFDTAMRLFQERGFDEVSVALIAATAGVSVPTFYAHYESKEHVVFMPVPTRDQLVPLISAVPADLPMAERIRRMAPYWFAHFREEELARVLPRWRMVSTTPSLRIRAAEFERTTAEAVIDAIEVVDERPLTGAERVVARAYLSALTSAFLVWGDSNGERDLQEIAEESFEALR